MEVTNRFKGFDLIEYLKTMDGASCTGGSDPNNPQENKMQKGCLRRPYK